MFELDINTLKEQGMQLMDAAKKTAIDLADKGKNQLDLISQQAKLSKAQRQLGALVYTLHKAGEENQPLVDKYIDAIAEIEASIDDIKSHMTPEERAAAEAAEEPDDELEDITAEVTETPKAEKPEDEEVIEEEKIKLRGITKTCPVCSAEVDGDALFCNHCGAQL